jgi:hypothetical protein
MRLFASVMAAGMLLAGTGGFLTFSRPVLFGIFAVLAVGVGLLVAYVLDRSGHEQS